MVLISCMVTVQLICAFVFANPESKFSHDPAHFTMEEIKETIVRFIIKKQCLFSVKSYSNTILIIRKTRLCNIQQYFTAVKTIIFK